MAELTIDFKLEDLMPPVFDEEYYYADITDPNVTNLSCKHVNKAEAFTFDLVCWGDIVNRTAKSNFSTRRRCQH